MAQVSRITVKWLNCVKNVNAKLGNAKRKKANRQKHKHQPVMTRTIRNLPWLLRLLELKRVKPSNKTKQSKARLSKPKSHQAMTTPIRKKLR
ncbi:hypothetical protein VMD_37050 [Vibrio mimicus VM573]|nr:hypothetical protein VMD_37050 [Vibrio mimicus VM573]